MEAPHDQVDILGYLSSSTGDCAPCGSTFTKRKRTQRRQRATPAPVLSSSSTNSSLDFSAETTTTTEEEDMAHCLILLAQGHTPAATAMPEKFTSRRFNETATTTGGKAGFYVYECKTCFKCFPTFQALGGHRASHKKPKIAAEENKFMRICLTNPSTSGVDANKLRVHQCSICRAEFSSGQALGGHMRRHRRIVIASPMQNQEIKKLDMNDEDSNNNNNINVLALDLNLPAPCDEINSGTVGFTFAAATSAFVDCHY